MASVSDQEIELNRNGNRRIPSPRLARAQVFILRLRAEDGYAPHPDGRIPPFCITLNHQLYQKFLIAFTLDREIVDTAIDDAAELYLIALEPVASGIQIEILEGYDERYNECRDGKVR